MRRYVFAVLVACVLAFSSTHVASACSCFPRSDDVAAAQADAVFVGTVTSVVRTADKRLIATFTVASATKGVRAGAVVTVDGGRGGGECGFDFQRGARYQVFASRENGVLTTGLCSGTRALS